ncbi:MAG: glycosyltransferase family 2 protein [Bryobacterales bacterium]|nr:glycosyltransferase family 2 protein [Bryobacterales bacterium]
MPSLPNPTQRRAPAGLLVLIPAYNEEPCIADVLHELWEAIPGCAALVVDDCSNDGTVAEAQRAGARVLRLPHHLGLGGAVQAGYKLAFELGYEYVIRIDGDGQHNPGDIPRIYDTLRETGVEMVIGSRFITNDGYQTTFLRSLVIRFFRLMLRPILGQPVRDPTSGFVGVNRAALAVFSRVFPLEYPEIEALVVLQRRAFRFREIPCKMRPRLRGSSSITIIRSVYFLLHVLLGVFVNILKYDGRRGTRKERSSGQPKGETSE